ncbi:MAG: 50S ribosomal protein L6 [Planctomycetes bacterium]|nr:50S ribosomal protein L6 [Planctomycetota bacterium]
MSRVGKIPVTIENGVTATVTADEVIVKGPKGEAKQKLVPGIKITVNADAKEVVVERESDTKENRALHGLYRSLINNMMEGVTKGYEKKLRIMGAGYRVELQGTTLVMNCGFGHPVKFDAPAGIEIEVPKSTSREYMDFIVRGIDKQRVGQVASQLRAVRPPNLYKGKGIRYFDENVRRLEGKSFGAGKK